PREDTLNTGEDIYITHVDDPWKFYCQLARCTDILAQLTENIGHLSKTVTNLISAVYSEDSLWYRAVVKDKTSEDLISVQYIDYGNTSVINVDQVAQSHVQSGLKYLQGWTLHHLSGQLLPVFDQCLPEEDVT
uniref:Tudor domain containing 6 n=1 Tax=Dromaius novaehollandiae TaxID=8790 RepID=A0A8C4K0S9_DRONO